jgi:hypothetical protein
VAVLHRWLDVFFEWAVWLVLALVLIPVTIGTVVIVSDRSQLVTARIWTDRPALLQDAGLANAWSNGTPASDADALLVELVGSDWFANEVLTAAVPGFVGLSADGQTAQRSTFRQDLKHAAAGDNVLSISYATDRPELGRALVASVITMLGNAVESLQLTQTTAAVDVLDNEVASARTAMQTALDAVGSYASGRTPNALLVDPHYQTLVVDATTATDYYVSIENLAHQAELAQSAIPSIRNATFRVIDAPAVSPTQFDFHTPAVKYSLEGLAGVAAVELLLVYMIGLRDPRVRSGEEVRRRLGIPYVGSTPDLASAA